jgi:hypothetical protein
MMQGMCMKLSHAGSVAGLLASLMLLLTAFLPMGREAVIAVVFLVDVGLGFLFARSAQLSKVRDVGRFAGFGFLGGVAVFVGSVTMLALMFGYYLPLGYVILDLAAFVGVPGSAVAIGAAAHHAGMSGHKPTVLVCPSCGRENPLDSDYCGKCARPLHDETKIY